MDARPSADRITSDVRGLVVGFLTDRPSAREMTVME
jgi:hypothetical protein